MGKVMVVVATLSDDLYLELVKHSRGDLNPDEFLCGDQLAKALLKDVLGERVEKLTVVTLNPSLYQENSPEDPGQYDTKTFYLTKLKAFGVPDEGAPEVKGADAEDVRELHKFPPLPYKNCHLRMLKVKYGVPIQQMLLIDDRPENLFDAQALGAYTMGVRNDAGLDWMDLEDWIITATKKDLPPPIASFVPAAPAALAVPSAAPDAIPSAASDAVPSALGGGGAHGEPSEPHGHPSAAPSAPASAPILVPVLPSAPSDPPPHIPAQRAHVEEASSAKESRSRSSSGRPKESEPASAAGPGDPRV